MINKIRGEVELELDGKKYRLVPSMKNILALEEQAGSLVGMFNRLVMSDFRFSDLLTVVDVFLMGEDKPTRAQLEDIVFEDGLTRFVEPVTRLVGNCLGGAKNIEKGNDDEGKPEAPISTS